MECQIPMENGLSSINRIPFPNAVLWDWDGVIADTLSIHAKTIKSIFESEGYNFDENYFITLVGQKDVIGLMVKREKPDIEETRMKEIHQKRQTVFNDLVEKNSIQAFPGIEDWTFFFFDKNIPQAIASSTSRENIEIILSNFRFKKYFREIITTGPNIPGKPDPTVFLLASQALGIKPEKCLVFEDTPEGILAAKRAGMTCIAITNTWPAENLTGADLIISSLKALNPDEIFITND